ncbi:PIN domain-containing protein [Mycolicibacterium chubuense]|uniref:PIN domain-containing protein n=1 Tax=Mycolicibacterium chubuense TaxID=1800 RepID=UPI001EF044AB|nr:PIN domain-containing protein [Mycolicibacterium chubuense]
MSHVPTTSASARQQHLQQAEADFAILSFDADCARAFGGVAAALRSTGRKPAARAYDALIAASAIAHGLGLCTCNPDDFAEIPRLDLHPVPIPRNRIDAPHPTHYVTVT